MSRLKTKDIQYMLLCIFVFLRVFFSFLYLSWHSFLWMCVYSLVCSFTIWGIYRAFFLYFCLFVCLSTFTTFFNFCMCMCYLYHCWMWGSEIIFITSIFLYLTYMPILPQQWQKSHFRVCKFQLFKEKHLLILMMLPCMHGKKNVSVCFWQHQKHFIPLIIIIK